MFERRILAINIDPKEELDGHDPRGTEDPTICPKKHSAGGFVLRDNSHIRLELDTDMVLALLRGGQPPN